MSLWTPKVSPLSDRQLVHPCSQAPDEREIHAQDMSLGMYCMCCDRNSGICEENEAVVMEMIGEVTRSRLGVVDWQLKGRYQRRVILALARDVSIPSSTLMLDDIDLSILNFRQTSAVMGLGRRDLPAEECFWDEGVFESCLSGYHSGLVKVSTSSPQRGPATGLLP